MADYPRFDANRILRLRDRLVDEVFYERYGTELCGEQLIAVADHAQQLLGPQVRSSVVYESLRPLAGVVLTEKTCDDRSWRLAGNQHRLRDGLVAPPWSTQNEDEWVLLQVLRGALSRNRRGDVGLRFDFRVLAGSPCPMVLTKFWSNAQCMFVAREVGFSRFQGKYTYSQGDQLVSLRLLGRLEAERSRERPFFHEVAASAGCLRWNRELLKLRFRYIPCPNNWTHECHECVVGYESCDGATHPRNYEWRHCTHCNKENYFDPDLSTVSCVDCDRRYRLRPRHT